MTDEPHDPSPELRAASARDPARVGDAILFLAVCAAFGAGLLAIAEHASTTSAGYQLAVALREHEELTKAENRSERRVAELTRPQAALARIDALKLPRFAYPKQWNVAAGRALAAALATVPPAAPSAPAGGAR